MGVLLSKHRAAKAKRAAPPPRAEPEISEDERAYLEVKRARDKITVIEKRLLHEFAVYNEKAREAAKKGNKEIASRFIRLRMLKERRRQEVIAQLGNLDIVLDRIETQKNTITVARAMEQGAVALAKLRDEMPLEEIERIMDETEESIAYVQEFEETLSRQVSQMPGLEEAALEELRKLEVANEATLGAVVEASEPISTPDVAPSTDNAVISAEMDIDMPQVPEIAPVIEQETSQSLLSEESRSVAVPA